MIVNLTAPCKTKARWKKSATRSQNFLWWNHEVGAMVLYLDSKLVLQCFKPSPWYVSTPGGDLHPWFAIYIVGWTAIYHGSTRPASFSDWSYSCGRSCSTYYEGKTHHQTCIINHPACLREERFLGTIHRRSKFTLKSCMYVLYPIRLDSNSHSDPPVKFSPEAHNNFPQNGCLNN